MSAPPLADREARIRAATIFDRNLVVVAGAGTGKTSLLVERYLNLVLSEQVKLEETLAITFTEKAMGEMRDRVAGALETVLAATAPGVEPGPFDPASEAGRSLAWLLEEKKLDRADLHRRARDLLDRIDLAAINTIHSTCSDMLRRNALDAGLPLSFSVDEGITQDLLFDDLWPEFLAEELGPEATRRALWAAVLGRLSETEVEEAARALCASPSACDQLARSGYEPVDPLEAFGDEVRRRRDELAAMREELAGRNAMPEFIETVLHLFEVFLAEGCDGLRTAAAGELPMEKFWDKSVPSPGPERQLGERHHAIKRAAGDARKMLDRLRGVDEAAVAALLEAIRPFARRFRKQVLREGKLVYDDLLLLARNLLLERPAVREHEAKRARAILVDEFQDTDPLQYEIVFLLAAADPRAKIDNAYETPLEAGRLFIVGDPKQSIYRFRGADMSAFMAARDLVLDGGREESLTTNFRSRPGVIEPINRLFENWMGPRGDDERDVEPEYEEIHAARPDRDAPNVEQWTVFSSRGDKAEVRRGAEARAIARYVRDWLAADPDRELRDIALLFRSLSSLPLYTRELARAGIDYVVDGGKAFVERPEVIEALALLEALANPADPVATLAVVRSPLGGATDAALADYVRAGGRFYWPAKRTEALARDFPQIDRALTWLRDLDRATRRLPIDRRIQVVLTESGFLLPQAAFFEGAQRTANIRKLAERAAGLARDRGLTLEETIQHLRGEFTGNRSEGESPLADEAVNAVRILTIHKAKGLEFPLVIVPDLGRAPYTPPPKTRVTLHLHQRRRRLAVTVGSGPPTQNLGSLLAAHENERHEEAENKRILYVAATRAKERLILVNSERQHPKGWVEALGAHWGYAPGAVECPPADGAFVDAGYLAGDAVRHRAVLADAPVEGVRAREDVPAVARAESFRDAAERARHGADSGFRTPSGDAHAEAVDAVPEEEPEPRARHRRLARAVGRAVHQALERADFAAPQSALDALRGAVPGQARELDLDPADVQREAATVLAGFLGSDLPERLARAEILGRETPILLRDDQGRTVHGYADLVYRLDGRVHVADYKTDAGAGPELAERYRSQLADYAAAVAGAMNLPAPPETELILIRTGERISL